MLDLEINQMNMDFNNDLASEYGYFNEIDYSNEILLNLEEKEPYQDFFLYCDLNENPKFNDCLLIPEDHSTKDKLEGSLNDDSKSISISSEKVLLTVPFNGELPDMKQFERLIQMEIMSKGANQVVCDALELKEDSESDNDQAQLIQVKKRKSKEQLIALEQEFQKNNDWTKEFMNQFAEKIQLDPAQVYKWHWDQICKKLGRNPKKQEKALKKQQNSECGKKRKRSGAKKSSNKLQKVSE